MGQALIKEKQQTTYNDDGTAHVVGQSTINSPDVIINFDYKGDTTWVLSDKTLTETITRVEVTRSDPPNHPIVAMIESGFSNAPPMNSKIIKLTESEFTVRHEQQGVMQTCTR